MQYRDALIAAKHDFANRDPELMAELAGGLYKHAGNEIEIAYCGYCCRISYPRGEIMPLNWPGPTNEEKIIMLQYLGGASGLPARKQWLSFLELPGGPHHYAPFQKEAIFPLARHFGASPDNFRRAAQALGGKESQYGHAGMEIPAFPRLPLAFVLWAGDDEFPASANILFDSVSETYLSTSSLYMLGIAVAQRLLKYPGFPGDSWYDAALD